VVISACEWIFGGRPLPDVVALLARNGYDAIEISGEPGRPDAATLREEVRSAGLAISGITAICNWPTDERDLASPDGAVRNRAVEYYKACIDLAEAVGAPVVGLIPAAVGRLDALSGYEREWSYAVAGARAVARYAAERDVAVGVEAINRYETFLVNRVEQALAFAEEVDVAGVGVVADVFHMQLEEVDTAAALALAGERLLALHLADSNRLGLGRGQLALTPILEAARAIGFEGPLVMEFTAPGPNPFKADKGPEAMRVLEDDVRSSAAAVREHAGARARAG
jgi:D-psicose/D-tagatose/L-ribulose 3-epimerase